jgi:hypothetical protein
MKQPVLWCGLTLVSLSLFSSLTNAETCEQKTDRWPYVVSQGNDQAEIAFAAELSVERSCERLAATGTAEAYAQIFGLDAQLLDSAVGVSVVDRNQLQLAANLTVMGYVVESIDEQMGIGVGFQNSAAIPIDLSDRQTIMVGPIPVGVTYGLAGEAGVDYAVRGEVLQADADVNPYLDTDIYARAGVDAVIARVEASGEVQLLDERAYTKLIVSMDQVDFNRVDVTAYGDHQLDALEGRIDVFAGANLGSLSPEYSAELLNWSGYSRADPLYDIRRSFTW